MLKKKYQAEFAINSELLKKLDKGGVNEIQKYWCNNYGYKIDLFYHTILCNYTGVIDPYYIPLDVWWFKILPYYNNFRYKATYSDKNLLNLLLSNSIVKMPNTIIKRMHGRYYNSLNQLIEKELVLKELLSQEGQLIIKASDTDNGFGVRMLLINDKKIEMEGVVISFDEIENIYGSNYVIQHKVIQHNIMAEPHPTSVNTIRMITFRCYNEIRILLAYLRIGTDFKLTDNTATGGLLCGIDGLGQMHSYAVDPYGTRHIKHPQTGYQFSKRAFIPSFDRVVETAKELHKQIFHFDILSWDFSIDNERYPILIEVNFRGPVLHYQIACEKSLFGDLTTDVLRTIKHSHMTNPIDIDGLIM